MTEQPTISTREQAVEDYMSAGFGNRPARLHAFNAGWDARGRADMTERQYTVIADAAMTDLRRGDLAVIRVDEGYQDGAWSAEPGLIRIERPVPTPRTVSHCGEFQDHERHGACVGGPNLFDGEDDTPTRVWVDSPEPTRPVPTTDDKPEVVGLSDEQWQRIKASTHPVPTVPTREQIAEVIGSLIVAGLPTDPDVIRAADAVLALIEKGTGR